MTTTTLTKIEDLFLRRKALAAAYAEARARRERAHTYHQEVEALGQETEAWDRLRVIEEEIQRAPVESLEDLRCLAAIANFHADADGPRPDDSAALIKAVLAFNC